MKKGFTLIELLVVVSIIATLLGILMPSLAKVRQQAKVLAVNSDLRQIGLAIECYFLSNKEYPPTKQDCAEGSLKDHLNQIPEQLADGQYLPKAAKTEAMSTIIQDRFNIGHTYKYASIGECIVDRNIISKWIKTRLWIPDSFPNSSSLDLQNGQWYDDIKKSPVKWVIFSIGPNFDENFVRSKYQNKYPISSQTWYNRKDNRGFIVRIHKDNGDEIGTFRED